MADLSLKYRPKKFKNLIQPGVVTALKNAIVNDRLSHCYMFSGPRGCGKTSSARLLAMAVCCPNRGDDGEPCGKCETCQSIVNGNFPDVLEINAAQQRGIDDMWSLVATTLNHPPMIAPRKVYILDECHMLTPQAQNSLLKALEEPPSYALFILCTTEQRKVLPTIVDRSHQYQFGLVPISAVKNRLEKVCAAEGIGIDEAALNEISRASGGSMRLAYKLLEKVWVADSITMEEVRLILGRTASSAAIDLLDLISRRKRAGALKMVDELAAEGKDVLELFREMLSAMSDMLRIRLRGPESITWRSDEEVQKLTIVDGHFQGAQLEGLYRSLRSAVLDLSNTAMPKDITAMMSVMAAITAHEEGEPK